MTIPLLFSLYPLVLTQYPLTIKFITPVPYGVTFLYNSSRDFLYLLTRWTGLTSTVNTPRVPPSTSGVTPLEYEYRSKRSTVVGVGGEVGGLRRVLVTTTRTPESPYHRTLTPGESRSLRSDLVWTYPHSLLSHTKVTTEGDQTVSFLRPPFE